MRATGYDVITGAEGRPAGKERKLNKRIGEPEGSTEEIDFFRFLIRTLP